MDFDPYGRRILSLHDYETIDKITKQKIQKRLQVKNGTMNIAHLRKCQFLASYRTSVFSGSQKMQNRFWGKNPGPLFVK